MSKKQIDKFRSACRNVVWLVLAVVFFSLSSCGGGGDQFLGNWTSSGCNMTITKDRDIFLVNISEQSFDSCGLPGKFTAKPDKDTLHLDNPNMGDARLSSDAKTIYLHGREWRKK